MTAAPEWALMPPVRPKTRQAPEYEIDLIWAWLGDAHRTISDLDERVKGLERAVAQLAVKVEDMRPLMGRVPTEAVVVEREGEA